MGRAILLNCVNVERPRRCRQRREIHFWVQNLIQAAVHSPPVSDLADPAQRRSD